MALVLRQEYLLFSRIETFHPKRRAKTLTSHAMSSFSDVDWSGVTEEMERLITHVRRLPVRKKRTRGTSVRECEIAANLSGYEYQFSNRASMDGKCTVCHLKMKALVQNVSCEHRFCKTCMESLSR